MEAARLLYGELELDASQGLYAVGQLDAGIDLLGESILDSQESLQGLFNTIGESSESINSLAFSFEGLKESMSVVGMFLILGGILFELITSTESFQKVLAELKKAFEPLLKIIGQFAEAVGNFISGILIDAIKVLGQFITYLTKTEQGLALLKTAAIFFAVVAGVLLVASLKSLAVAAYGALTAFTAMLTPLMPFILTASLVVAAITSVILVLEDLYYFATGEGESVAADFFSIIGLSKEEIEEIRVTLKAFIDSIKIWWESFTKTTTKLVPQFKKIFASLLAIAKTFFIAVFKLGYDLVKVFKAVWDIIQGIFTGNFDLIKSGFNKIWDSIKSIFYNMTSYITSLFDNVLTMIDPLKEVINSIGSLFKSKDLNVNVNTTTENKNTISGKRASGGNVEAGKSYIVGEKGEEIFTPNTSGFITPNNQITENKTSTAKTIVQSIIGNMTITINAGENMAQDLTSRVKEIIKQASVEAAQELGLVL